MSGSPKATDQSAEPRPVTADIDVFGLTDPGRVRRENQDQFLIASLHKLLRVHQSSIPPDDLTPLITESRGFVFLVADGVGGRPDGAQASGTVIRAIAHYVTHLTDLYRRLDSDREDDFLSELECAVLKTHDDLLDEGRREYGGKGAATTLTMLFAISNLMKLPAYGALGQLTVDNLLVGAVLLPAALIANYAGLWLVRRTPAELFFRIAYVLMFLISVELIRGALVEMSRT